MVIAHPNKEFILKLDISKIPEMSGLYKALGTVKKGVESYRLKGSDKIAGFASVEMTGWSLLVTQNEEEFLAASNSIRNAIMILAGIFLAVTILGVFYFARSITKPIDRVVELMKTGSDEVASASTYVSSATQSLAEGSSEQAASIEETSSSLEEISSMTKQNAEHALQANQLMKEVNQIIAQADASMQLLTTSMQDISQTSEETQKIVKTIYGLPLSFQSRKEITMNDKLSGKYLTCQLDKEEYGIAIIKVREIIGMAKLEGQVKILLDIDRVLTTEENSFILQAA